MTDWDWKAFERTWTQAIVDSINRIRTAKGVTVDELTKRLNAGGWMVSKATVAGIVSGNKRSSVSVAELAVFAWALRVPPMYLLEGQPILSEMPESPMWSKHGAQIPAFYGWFSAGHGASLTPSATGVFIDAKGQDIEAALTIATGLGMDAISQYSELLRRASWFAAMIVALLEIEDGTVLSALADTYTSSRRHLRVTIRELIKIRQAKIDLGFGESELPEGWRVQLGTLPEVMAFIDAGEPREDLRPSELRQIMTPEDYAEAKRRVQVLRDNLASIQPREHQLGYEANDAAS
jgi:hypothetical protein